MLPAGLDPLPWDTSHPISFLRSCPWCIQTRLLETGVTVFRPCAELGRSGMVGQGLLFWRLSVRANHMPALQGACVSCGRGACPPTACFSYMLAVQALVLSVPPRARLWKPSTAKGPLPSPLAQEGRDLGGCSQSWGSGGALRRAGARSLLWDLTLRGCSLIPALCHREGRSGEEGADGH